PHANPPRGRRWATRKRSAVIPGENLAELERLLIDVGAHEQGTMAGVPVAGGLPERQDAQVLAFGERDEATGGGLVVDVAVVVLAEHRGDAHDAPALGREDRVHLVERRLGRL